MQGPSRGQVEGLMSGSQGQEPEHVPSVPVRARAQPRGTSASTWLLCDASTKKLPQKSDKPAAPRGIASRLSASTCNTTSGPRSRERELSNLMTAPLPGLSSPRHHFNAFKTFSHFLSSCPSSILNTPANCKTKIFDFITEKSQKLKEGSFSLKSRF